MQSDTVPLSAIALKQIAALLCGGPEPDDIFLVVCYDPERQDYKFEYQDATGVYYVRNGRQAPERRAAALRQELSGTECSVAVLGPFQARKDRKGFDVVIHSVETSRGKRKAIVRAPSADVDLMCWSPSAFEKFIAPYYYELYGATRESADAVEEIKRKMIASDSGILVHEWPTYYSVLGDIVGEWKPL